MSFYVENRSREEFEKFVRETQGVIAKSLLERMPVGGRYAHEWTRSHWGMWQKFYAYCFPGSTGKEFEDDIESQETGPKKQEP